MAILLISCSEYRYHYLLTHIYKLLCYTSCQCQLDIPSQKPLTCIIFVHIQQVLLYFCISTDWILVLFYILLLSYSHYCLNTIIFCMIIFYYVLNMMKMFFDKQIVCESTLHTWAVEVMCA